jgi:Domain of unknown function (DUF4386)
MRRLWLTAGWLLIAYVVLTFAGAVFQSQLALGAKPSDAAKALVTSSLTKTYTGFYFEFIAALVFLVAALLLARLLRGEGETSAWLSSCIAGAAVTYVAVMGATGGAAGAAALYDGHHGASLATVTTVNDIRNFGYAISGGLAGVLMLAASAAGLVTDRLPRWFIYAGFAVGMICIAAVPAVKAGAPQTMLWFLWLLAAGIIAVRQARSSSAATVRAAMATS